MSSSGKTNAALAAAIIFLLLSSCSAYFAFGRLRASQVWVQHTRDVQGALNQFSVTVTRASRIRAEYVDSGDDSLLQREEQAVAEVRNALAALQKLTADNPIQRDVHHKLTNITEQRIALMNKSVELKRAGTSPPEVQAEIAKQLIAKADASDQFVQGMYQTEQRLLNERQGGEQFSFTLTVAVLATSLFLALILFLIHHQLLSDQVRERLRAETAMRALSARLMSVQDEERRRFGRELHDSVGQQLVAMKMAISSLEETAQGDPTLQDCLKILDDVIRETRTISHLLHPPLLDEAGLKSALRWFVEGFGKRSGIEVSLDSPDGMHRLPDSIELVLFRVLQESLTNVHRHSGAARADVSLRTSGSSVILRVKDHGHGIPPFVLHKLREDGTGGGVGLAGMTQRIREIGGRLEIHSDSAGTEVVARVPLTPGRQTRRGSPSELQQVG